MRKGRRKIIVDNTNEEVKGKKMKRKILKYLSVAEKFTLKL